MNEKWNNLRSYSWNISQISDHIDKDVDAVEKDGLVDELVVVVEKHRVAVERREADCRNSNLWIQSTNTNTKYKPNTKYKHEYKVQTRIQSTNTNTNIAKGTTDTGGDYFNQ